MWVWENESAKFWAPALNGLRNRGLEDIFIACTDTLTGFSAATEAVFPQTEIQACVIHQIRNPARYVSRKDLKALMADLKALYAAEEGTSAPKALGAFAQRWDKKYPKISASWQDNRPNLSTYFKFPQEVRRLIYTTNAIGSTAGSSARFISTISGTQAMRCIRSPYVWSDLRSKRACTKP